MDKILVVAGIYALVLGVFSLLPAQGGIEGFFVFDKILHIVGYFGLAFLLKRGGIRNAFWMAFGYGLLLEIFQIFVPGREFEALDLAANGIGSALVFLI